MRKILYIEGCNFSDFPLGGTLSFSKQLLKNVKDHFFLVGLGDSEEPVGKWFTKKINGNYYDYFAIGKTKNVEYSKLPKRLILFFMLSKYIGSIHTNMINVDLIFTQTPQFVFIIKRYQWHKFCFCFAGLGNSVGSSRYKFLRIFGGIYEQNLFKILQQNCDIILAAADEKAIDEKTKKYGLGNSRIISFPTRFDKEIFHPMDIINCRNKLQIAKKMIVVVAVGRLSEIKGWEDVIQSFRIFRISKKNSKLIFVGDGEDKSKLLQFASDDIQDGSIEIVGRKNAEEIAIYLNASNIFVMFSHFEGWPTSMVEAIACGKNIVSTRVSGAADMIIQGKNGFIIENRNHSEFAFALESALDFPNPNPLSISRSNRYSSDTLYDDFTKLTV